MIRLRSDWRGRPGTRSWVAECDTAREAWGVVKALREINIEAKWPSELPYRVHVPSERAREAVSYLEARDLEAAA